MKRAWPRGYDLMRSMGLVEMRVVMVSGDWLRPSFTGARPAFIAGGDAISSRHEGDGRRIQNVRLFPHLLERSMVEWICAPARSFRTAFLLSLRLSVQQTDALRVFQNGKFVGYDSLIREFLVRHSTFQCPQLCIRGKFRGDKKQLSERGWFHAVVSLPMFWPCSYSRREGE